jgi:predicted MFS family arabinose efflux permease
MSFEIAATASIEGARTSTCLASRLLPPIIALTAFLTLVDLFARQAILPSLARAYEVSPAAMGFAVNASAMGMAVASLAVAFLS